MKGGSQMPDIVGYARVSSEGQNLDRQIDAVWRFKKTYIF